MAKKTNKFGKFILLIILAVMVLGSAAPFLLQRKGSLSSQEASEKAVAYINENILGGESEASIVSVVEESGMYRIQLKINDQEFPSYISKDGQFLFPNPPINLEAKPEVAGQQAEQKVSCQDINKNGQPLLESFVVSKCPFGIQMQRIMLEIVKKIPSFKDYIQVRYLGSIEGDQITAMHGEEEAKENARQICIREEQPEMFWNYLECHIKKGEVESCLSGVDQDKLNSCLKERVVDYAKKDFEASDQYQASGSPALVLNGELIDEQGFSEGEGLTMRSAETVKKLLCCGFEQEPEACSQELTDKPAASQFSETYEAPAGSADGSCN